MAGLLVRVKEAVKAFRFAGAGGGMGPGLGGMYGGGGGWFKTEEFDYQREVGLAWENSVFWIGLRWIATNFQEADPCVLKYEKGSTKPTTVLDHPFALLMDEPNPDYDGGILAWGMVLSLLCSGQSYCIINRSPLGIPVSLYWVPWWQITPRWPQDGSQYIGWYDYTVNGVTYPLPKSAVMDIKFGMNPTNYRRGLSGFNAVLPQACTINEGARFMAAVTRNPAIFSALFSPKANIVLNKEQHEDLKAKLQQYTGANRGGILVPNIPLEVHKTSWSPDEMALDTSLKMPEAHIAASMGLSTTVLNLTAGERRDTFNNKMFAIKESYDNGVKPLHKCVARQARRSLSVLFQPGERAAYDYSLVGCQQEQRTDRAKRLFSAAGGPYLSINEARLEDGYPKLPGEEYDKVRNAAQEQEEDPKEDPKKPKDDEDDEDDE